MKLIHRYLCIIALYIKGWVFIQPCIQRALYQNTHLNEREYRFNSRNRSILYLNERITLTSSSPFYLLSFAFQIGGGEQTEKKQELLENEVEREGVMQGGNVEGKEETAKDGWKGEEGGGQGVLFEKEVRWSVDG